MKKLVTFVAAVFRIAKMSFTMLAAVFGCVKINHTMSATKRNPTILFTPTTIPRRLERPLTALCTTPTGSAVSSARARTKLRDKRE